MALTHREVDKLFEVAAKSLDAADERWGVAAQYLEKRALHDSLVFAEKSIATPYPGVSSVESRRPEVRDYFVLMADMRSSTSHLRLEPPSDSLVESGLHRLYLETAGLLPTLAYHVRARGGRVTEFLGDGVLAFVQGHDLTDSKEFSVVVELADECLEICNDVVSELLSERYQLPAIVIGVGISVGQAIITALGVGDDERATAFGTPVFEASKMSKAHNEVILSQNIREKWPKGPGGKRKFSAVTVRGSDIGYRTWVP